MINNSVQQSNSSQQLDHQQQQSEDLDSAIALQMYYDEQQQQNKKNKSSTTNQNTPTRHHPYNSGSSSSSSSNNNNNKLRRNTTTIQSTFNNAKKDVERKLLNFFNNCISTLESGNLPAHLIIFSIKNLLENQEKKIDSHTRIELFSLGEIMKDKIIDYFTTYLDNCSKNLNVLTLEKYFILKSFKYLAEDISYTLMKGDETCKYKNTGILDFDDHIGSIKRRKIFLDGGRKQSPTREVIVIDEENDTSLQLIVETLRLLLMKKFPSLSNNSSNNNFQTNNSSLLLEIFSFMSQFVSSSMGGISRDVVEFSNAFIENLCKKTKSKRIMIGDIKMGVCRHRSILFKYLCDHLFVSGLLPDIRCRLVRGQVKGENHAWNIVSVINCQLSPNNNNSSIQKFFLVDIMLYPGKLYDIDSIEANTYMRQEFGSIGGLSVRLPTNVVETDSYYNLTSDNKKFLGRGATGKVLAVQTKLPILGNVACAVKKVVLQNNNERTLRELSLLTYVSHRNIIKFYNARTLKTSTETSLYIYMELMDCNARGFISDFKMNITKETREYVFELLFFLVNVAKGISYLHSKNIIHRDIKPENITLKYSRNTPITIEEVKLVDFDIANILDKSNLTICGTAGYVHYQDLLEPKKASTSLDLYSFGILVGEMFMDISPIQYFIQFPNDYTGFMNYYSIQNIEKQIDTKFTCIPSSYRQTFKEIISDCIQPQADKRPKISQILVKLENYLLKNYVKKAEEVLYTTSSSNNK